MCGRIYEIFTDEELSARYLGGVALTSTVVEAPIYNLCPTQESPVLRIVDGKRQFDRMRWQLVPANEPTFTTRLSTINARSESIFKSRLYRDLILRQRTIVPISGMPHAAYR
jgi:putative SOS response-associated peptidase YedK